MSSTSAVAVSGCVAVVGDSAGVVIAVAICGVASAATAGTLAIAAEGLDNPGEIGRHIEHRFE